jgi:hypothetical protein
LTSQGEGVLPGRAGFKTLANALDHTFDMLGMVHFPPAPALHLFKRGPGVVMPTLVVPVYPAGLVSGPRELTDVIGELPEARLAVPEGSLGSLALGDVEGQALETYKAAARVELGSRGFLEPYFAAVGAYEAEGDRMRGTIRADTANERFEACAIVRMDPCKKVGCAESLLRVQPQDLRGILAPPRQTRSDIPIEGRHRPGRQRLLQPRLTLHQRGRVLASLCKQGSENDCAQRHSQDAGLGEQNAVGDRETEIAENTNAKCCRPNDHKGNDERARGSEHRLAAGRKPQQHREQ